jgi:hypothetical protein
MRRVRTVSMLKRSYRPKFLQCYREAYPNRGSIELRVSCSSKMLMHEHLIYVYIFQLFIYIFLGKMLISAVSLERWGSRSKRTGNNDPWVNSQNRGGK